MPGPWEKYSGATQAPWEKYGGTTSQGAGLDELPPSTPTGNTAQFNTPEHQDSLWNKILGVGEAGISAGTGMLAAPVGQVAGIAKTLTGGKYGTQAGVEQGEKEAEKVSSALTYQPRTQTGKDILQNIGGSEAMRMLQGMPVTGAGMSRIPEVPRGVLAAGEGMGQVNRNIAGMVGHPAQALAQKAVSALPNLDPETQNLAREAHSMGFRLSPHEVYGNKYGKFAGEMAQENPLISTNREHNQNVFNQNLVNMIGGEGNKVTRKTFNQAMKNSGETIGAIAESKNVPFDEPFISKLTEHVNEADNYQPPDVSRVIRSYVNDITDKAKDGVLSGKAFRTINTKLNNQIRNSQNGDLKRSLSSLQDDLQEQFTSQLSPEELNKYNNARRQYAVGKTIEPLVAKAPTGDIPPASLLGAITRTQAGKSAAARGAAGDLGKLADIGQRFLKQQPSSGTAERSVMQNLLTHPIGSIAAGATAAATAPVAAAYNKYGPKVTQQLIDRPPEP